MIPTKLSLKQAACGLLALSAICVASMFVYRHWQSDWATRPSAFTAPKSITMACAKCGAAFPTAGPAYVAQLRAQVDQFLVACPQCKQVAARPATQCGWCRKHYLALGHDGQGYPACPHCRRSEAKAVPGSEPLSIAR